MTEKECMILSISQGDHFSEKPQKSGNKCHRLCTAVCNMAKYWGKFAVGENCINFISAVRCIEHVGRHLGSSDCNCRSSVRCFQPVWKMITLDTIF